MILIFITIASSLLALIHFVVYEGLVTIFLLGEAGRLVLGSTVAFLGFSFIFASVLAPFSENKFLKVYHTFAVTWLGFLVYLFIASCIFALGLIGVGFFDPLASLHVFGMMCVALALMLGLYGLFHAQRIVVKEVDIVLLNLPGPWIGRRMVFVSDIHLGTIRTKKFAQRVVGVIQEQNPDMVCIGGDLYDGVKVDEVAVVSPFAELKPPHGIFFVTGNHEEFRKNDHLLDAIQNAGIRVLHNEIVEIDGVQFVGVTDRDSTNTEVFATILRNLRIQSEKPSILLKHQPSGLHIAENAGISLQISGHTHKAQMIPLNMVTRLVYKGYDYGLKYFKNMAVYTSSGVGTWGPPMRVGTNGEIVVFIFKNLNT